MNFYVFILSCCIKHHYYLLSYLSFWGTKLHTSWQLMLLKNRQINQRCYGGNIFQNFLSRSGIKLSLLKTQLVVGGHFPTSSLSMLRREKKRALADFTLLLTIGGALISVSRAVELALTEDVSVVV